MSTVVNEVTPFAQYEASAGADTFQYTWWIREETDLKVYVDGELVATTDYTVSGTQTSTGGNVVFDTPLTGGEIVTISTDYPFERLTGFATSGSLRAAALNLELSYLVACILQLQRDIQRTLKLSPSSQVDTTALVLPEPEDQRILYWNGTEGVISNSAFNIDVLEGNAADIAANLTAINALYTQLAAILNVSANLGTDLPVTVVAANTTSLTTVATNIANVNLVGGSIASVNSVAGGLTNVNTVATNIANIGTVAGINANVTTVAGISDDVTAVAGDATDIGTVASNIANVNTVAGMVPVTTLQNLKYFNIMDYGAVGDGVTDDLPAIRAACAAVTANGGGLLYIPHMPLGFCCKRASTLTDRGAIFFSEVSNVTIYFEPGAFLLIDNLNTGTGNGDQYSGIYIDGGRNDLVNGVSSPGHIAVGASNIFVHNPDIRWKTKAAARSIGYGLCFKGSASDVAANAWGYLRNVHVINGYTEKAPQGGCIFLGVDQPKIVGWEANNTWADGCHFNACRRPQGNTIRGVGLGDDVCALVTYYDASAAGGSGVYSPWNKSALGTFSNTDCQISNIVGEDGSANCVRCNGVNGGMINHVLAEDCNYAVQVDSAIAGGSYSWTVQASQNLKVSDVEAYNCAIGIFMQCGNVTSASDQQFWDFSGVEFNSCRSFGASSYGHHIKNYTYGVKMKNVWANKTMLFQNIIHCDFDGIVQEDTSANMRFLGTSGSFTNLASTPEMYNRFHNIRCVGNTVLFQDMARIEIGNVDAIDSLGSGIALVRLRDVACKGLFHIKNANRSASGGTVRSIYFAKLQNARGLKIDISQDSQSLTNFVDIGGGDATDITKDVRADITVRNAYNSSSTFLSVQGGTYAPTDLWYVYRFYNGGEAVPVWRYRNLSEDGIGVQRVSDDRGDAAVSLTVGVDEVTQIFNTPLTAARAVTLNSTTRRGMKFRIVRTATATGAFNLNVGSGPLKALTAAGQWCEVEHNGTAWVLTAYGSL